MSRGSEWGRWDLHIHTKGTAKNDQFGNITLDDFCVELFSKALEKDIKVIGITDYFSIENFEKVRSFQKDIYKHSTFTECQKDAISKIFLIPNIELRIIPTTSKSKLVNIHIIFNPEIIEDFKSGFMSKVEMTTDNKQKFNLTRHDVTSLGKHHDSKAVDNDTAYKIGLKEMVISHTDIIDAINSRKILSDNCLIFVSNNSTDGVSGVGKHETPPRELMNTIYRTSNGIFSPKLSDIEYFIGKRADNKEAIIEKYGSLKPCIHGSDAHCLEELFNPDLDRYCWIKAEPTFEGLKQILHEPETRVYIGSNRPEPKTDYEVIDRIEINHENIGTKALYLNPNLNTIIGGRSSGKSTLVQCIANKIAPESIQGDKLEKHVEKISDCIKIIWKDDTEDNSRSIDYFYQGHMFHKTHEEGIESIVENILFELNPKIYKESDEKIAKLRQNNASQLSQYFSNKNLINQNFEQAHSIGNKKDILEEIKKLNQLINESSVASYNEVELKEHSEKQVALNKLESALNILNSTIEDINGLSIKHVLEINNPFLEKPNYELIKGTVEESFDNIENYAKLQVEKLKQTVKTKLDNNKNDYNRRISSIKTDSKFKEIEEYLKATESIKPLINQKTVESKKLENITQLEMEIDELRKESETILAKIYVNWRIINNEPLVLTQDIKVLEDDSLEISPIPKFKREKFNNFIVKYINQQPEKAQSFANSEFSNVENLLLGFNEIDKALKNRSIKLKSGFTEESFYSEFLTTSWFKLSYDVLYEGDSYTEMSQGKKAFVVLKLSLECSDRKCPIIIDQPEDDLDNRAIYTELVKYIKNKKSQRQIILVTHNANVVVNADSEQIIVANQHGTKTPNRNNKKFEYKCGSIESSVKAESPETSILASKTIKEHICEILEGGDTAFKLRERKYNI